MYDRWSQNSTCLLEIEVSPVGQRSIWINNQIKKQKKNKNNFINESEQVINVMKHRTL